MLKLIVVLPPALLLVMMGQQPAASPDKLVPADAVKLVNPVKATPASQAHAKKLYDMDCAMCHGAKGDGKGDLVADMQLQMKDFTDPTVLKGKSDGELFYTIKNGDEKAKMPSEGPPRAKDDDLWNLVVLVRSFSNNKT